MLETKQEGRVLRIWLNRPDRRNALTTELCRELVQAIDGAERDANIGSVLLAARGDAFCAGMDLGELATNDVERVSRVQETLFTMGARSTKPLLAAVQGPALGGGTGLVANCHLVIAAENATFGMTGIRAGLWPFVFFHAVSAAIGERRALALTITGELLNAADAQRTGLVHEVTSVEELEPRAFEVAQTIAGYSASALRSGLAFVQGAQGQPWKAAAGIGRLVRNEFLKSTEFQGNLKAFLEQK